MVSELVSRSEGTSPGATNSKHLVRANPQCPAVRFGWFDGSLGMPCPAAGAHGAVPGAVSRGSAVPPRCPPGGSLLQRRTHRPRPEQGRSSALRDTRSRGCPGGAGPRGARPRCPARPLPGKPPPPRVRRALSGCAAGPGRSGARGRPRSRRGPVPKQRREKRRAVAGQPPRRAGHR